MSSMISLVVGLRGTAQAVPDKLCKMLMGYICCRLDSTPDGLKVAHRNSVQFYVSRDSEGQHCKPEFSFLLVSKTSN